MGIFVKMVVQAAKGAYIQDLFFKSAYPVQLWVDQAEIPEETCAEKLDSKFLLAYQAWLTKILFFLEHITEEIYCQLYATHAKWISYKTLLCQTKQDLESVHDGLNLWKSCLDNLVDTHLMVG